ncbi:hypothetical protein CPB86DRAFT_778071 [Serendipita vermifera]|nr:hypothetical protein CPB86DRAFT_778071 [Serendipita vermifera]
MQDPLYEREPCGNITALASNLRGSRPLEYLPIPDYRQVVKRLVTLVHRRRQSIVWYSTYALKPLPSPSDPPLKPPIYENSQGRLASGKLGRPRGIELSNCCARCINFTERKCTVVLLIAVIIFLRLRFGNSWNA